MKRMKHEKHGFHHPLNNVHREEMLKAGWVDEDGPVIEGNTFKVVATLDSSQAIAPAIVPAVKRAPGRPRKEK